MKKRFARFIAALTLLALPSCCPPGRPKVPLPRRPVLENVSVTNCRGVDRSRVCDVEIDPLLRNDEALKNFIERLLSLPCFE